MNIPDIEDFILRVKSFNVVNADEAIAIADHAKALHERLNKLIFKHSCGPNVEIVSSDCSGYVTKCLICDVITKTSLPKM